MNVFIIYSSGVVCRITSNNYWVVCIIAITGQDDVGMAVARKYTNKIEILV